MSSVQYEHVTCHYPGAERPSVSDLSLKIADGEFLVLVGPSGCGKSTTLRMLAGLEDVSDGAIRIGGEDVTHVASRDRDIAMVFQNYALYPHMSVRDNMGFALKIAKVPESERNQRIEEAAGSWTSPTTWNANPRPCPVASGNAWPWAVRSCARPRCS